jgi:hypothetical protein
VRLAQPVQLLGVDHRAVDPMLNERRALLSGLRSEEMRIAEEKLMSAYLDKSQGITFVYSNIFELYKN